MHDADALHDSHQFDLRDPPKCLLEILQRVSCLGRMHMHAAAACDPFGLILFLVVRVRVAE